MTIIGRNDYMLLANKTQEGTPNQVYYNKSLTNGELYFWLQPNDVKEYAKFTARVPIQNLDSITDDFELAAEWYETVAWNLALRLMPKYGKAIDPGFKLQAAEFLESAKISDSENTSVFIQVGRRR
jgi:hypothetical protein